MAKADVLLDTRQRLTFDDYDKLRSGLVEMLRHGKKFIDDPDQCWMLNIDHIVMVARMEDEEE